LLAVEKTSFSLNSDCFSNHVRDPPGVTFLLKNFLRKFLTPHPENSPHGRSPSPQKIIPKNVRTFFPFPRK